MKADFSYADSRSCLNAAKRKLYRKCRLCQGVFGQTSALQTLQQHQQRPLFRVGEGIWPKLRLNDSAPVMPLLS